MLEQICECGCGVRFQARQADINRGWGLFSSKSCKAIWQERRTGQNAAYHRRKERNPDDGFQMSAADLAMGGYGDADWNTPFGDGKY